MAKEFTDRSILIPKNESSDDTAALRIQSNQETETITFSKQSWGSSHESITFPRQFLKDVIDGLQNVKDFVGA